ncbi:MAG: M36 family metallopeptidase [Longimicrobiales bacterium]
MPDPSSSTVPTPAERTARIQRALAFVREQEGPEGAWYESVGSVRRTSTGWSVVALQQVLAGVPVLHGIRSVRFHPDGRPVSVTGSAVPLSHQVATEPEVPAAEAARVGFLELARIGALAPELAFTAGPPETVAALSLAPRPTVMRKDPLADPIVASLVLDAGGRRPRLLWELRFRLPAGGGSYLVRVDALGSGVPTVREVIRASSHATGGTVYDFDPRTPARSRPFPRPLDEYPAFPGGRPPGGPWIEGAETRGDNVDVRLPGGSRVRATPVQGHLRFDPDASDEYGRAAVNAFYLCNTLHDFFYLLGFDERAGNFQRSHADGTPGAGDPVCVLIRDREVSGLGFFENRTDGTEPSLELGPHPSGRHSAFDAHLVIHEFAHGVTDRIVGARDDLWAPLQHEQSRALGEGFSDYWAVSIQNYERRRAARAAGTPEDDAETWAYAGWLSGNHDRGLRSRSYADHDGTYASLRGRGMNAHTAGEVWCATLLDLNRALGQGDRDRGDVLGWKLVFDSLNFLHPGRHGPHFLHARDALLSAYDALVIDGVIPADDDLRSAVHGVFRDRGMGGDASSKNGRFRSAEEGSGPITRDPEEHG